MGFVAGPRRAREPADLATIDLLSVSMLAGGAARLVSMRDRGLPHPLYVGLTAIEFVVPAAILAMTRAERKQGRR